MFNRKLMTMLATLAAMAGISTFAASANASVLDTDAYALDSEEVDVIDGSAEWDFVGGVMTPRITGTLRVENLDDSCGRVVIEHFDGATLLDTEEGNDMCVTDDDVHEWNINRSGVSNALTDTVVVSVEKLEFGVWQRQDEDSLEVHTGSDDFVVLAQGIDIGGPGWAGTEPANDADIYWNFDQGQFTPEIDAWLHMRNMGGDCGRIKARFLADDGTLIDSRASTPRCPADNQHYDWVADVPAYSSGLIAQLEVVAQTRAGGQWNNAGSATLLTEK
jgi:hypothetical protein